MNGAGDHSRKSSVTISANGPNSYSANGGAPSSGGGSKSGIQFGFKDSPAIAHSTPQMAAAPIPIPGGTQNQRVPSPAHSPSPIPQPSASGGRPPSGMAQQNMTFGSLGSDGDRHMRQGSIPQNPAALASQQGAHIRRESAVSQHSDMSAGPAGPNPSANRPNFNPQGGRGRGNPGFNPQHTPYNNNTMGFPPNYRPNQAGRGAPSMPPAFQPGRPMSGYPNSPGPARSPALAHSQPGTPNMNQAQMHPMQMSTPPQYYQAPPNMPPHQQFAGYPPYGAQFDPRQAGPGGYMPQPYMGQAPSGSPATNFQQPYGANQYHAGGPTTMSRTSSHSERPPSSTSQHNQGPVVVSGSQSQNGQKASSTASGRAAAKKSSAIPIKNLAGETIDVSTFKHPASPSPGAQPSKTPPVMSSTPPPQKPQTVVAHGRTDSQSTPKSAKEIQEELRAKIMKAASGGDEKSKADDPVKTAEPEEEKKKAEETALAKAELEAKAEEAEAPEPAAKNQESAASASKLAEPAPPAADDEEDEIERQIREMEEAEAKREAEAAEYEKKKKARLEEEKKQAEANKAINAAEEDRKLKEAEREAERLEEEKERKRNAGSTPSVADALAQEKSAETADAKVGDVTDKLSSLDISGKAGDAKPSPAAEKQRGSKPPALNLTPLNTKSVEPPQPSAALQSLKSARFLNVMQQDIYPEGIRSPNPAVNSAVAKKGKTFKYDSQFLLQFQKVFTEQPSLEFHQQVKSLIGDAEGSRSASTPRTGGGRNLSRNNSFAPNQQGSSMGSFASRDARGTTSAERFAMANAAMGAGGKAPAPGGMGSFGRPGSGFPMGAPMSRNPSTANVGAPNSPRTNSTRNNRGGSSRRVDHKEAQAAKTMPLTAGMELKPIATTAGGWKPRSIMNKSAGNTAQSDHMDPETVQRKVKSNLNKMTPEKFEKIAEQIQAIAAQSKDESDGRTLRQVIQLTFEKATDEAHWASMYAKFCRRMLDTMSTDIRDETLKDKNGEVVSGGALFRKYLLNRCQEEFERGWKSNLPEPPKESEGGEKPTGEAAMLSDEYYVAAAAKRRGLGLVQFIGELYKLGMLTERIMHACVQKLVDYETTPEEAEIESLCKLLRTIGANLDASPRGKGFVDAYFTRIQTIIDLPDLPSRLKFMLMDVVDLRRTGWAIKEANKGPKTLEEVRAEAEAAAALKAQENARSNQRGGPGGRPTMGRGDARSFSNFQQQNSNQVGMDDLRRLKGATNRTASGNVTLGPTSMFSSRSNSGRRLGPGGSLGRAGGDSGGSSRTGTPPTTHTNAFSALANLESETPASPPTKPSELSKQESASRPAESAQAPGSDSKADKN